MADAEGLLGQQLGAAVQIPYENIKANQTGIEMAMNAFQVAQQVKLKRQELEGRMQALVERNRQLEITGDLREKMTAMRIQGMIQAHGLAEERLDFERQKAATGADVAYQKLDLEKSTDARRAETATEKLNQINARGEAQSKLFRLDHDLVTEGYKQGTDAYQAEMLRRSWELSKDLSPSEFTKLRGDVISNASLYAKRQQEIDAFEENQFKKRAAGELYGNAQIDPLSAITHPENLWDEYKKDPNSYNPFAKQVPTGKKRIDYIDPATGIRKNVGSATPQRLTELNEEWQEMRRRHGETAQPPPDSLRDDSAANSKKERARSALNDPEATDAEKAQARRILSQQ